MSNLNTDSSEELDIMYQELEENFAYLVIN
jgi:hypothetical protein